VIHVCPRTYRCVCTAKLSRRSGVVFRGIGMMWGWAVKLQVGPVKTIVDADYWEIQDLAVKLKLENEPDFAFISPDGEMYSGLVPLVRKLMPDVVVVEESTAVPIEVSDAWLTGLLPGVELRDYQRLAVQKLLSGGRGLIELPTGSGKTESAVAASKILLGYGKQILFCSGSLFITEQAAARYRKYGIDDVGLVMGDTREFGHAVTCATIQTLNNGLRHQDDSILSLLQSCDVVIADEVHHSPASSYVAVLERCGASYRFGLSATLFEDLDEYAPRDLALIGLIGMPLLYVPLHVLVERGILPTPFVIMSGVLSSSEPIPEDRSWDGLYSACITRNRVRNGIAADIARTCVDRGIKLLIFVGHVEAHGLPLLELISRYVPGTIFVTGNREVYTKPGEKPEEWDLQRLREYVQSRDQVVVIASPALDEGVDIPDFGGVMLCGGGKKPRRVYQRMGRGMRSRGVGDTLLVFDFWDAMHPTTERHSRRRLKLYRRERIRVCSVMDWIKEPDPWKLPAILLT